MMENFIWIILLLATVFLIGFTDALAREQDNPDEVPCADGWLRIHRGCYQFDLTAKSWESALAECKAQHGDLLSIQSQKEKDMIEAHFKTSMLTEKLWWVGLKREANEWKWMGGEKVTPQITPWISQLMKTKRRNSCGILDMTSRALKISSEQCDSELQFICEFHSITPRFGYIHTTGLLPTRGAVSYNDFVTSPGVYDATTTPATTTPATTTADITTETSTTAETVATSTGTAQTVRQDFECHLNYMHVFIPVDLVPNSQLTLRDPNCRLINNGTHHKISFDYDECGTSQNFYTDYISVENDVNVHNIFNDTAEISFVEDYKIPLRCLVDRSKLLNGVIQVMPRESIQESVVQKTDFDMKEFTTKDYNQEITEYPVKLPINKEIFFEIAMTNRSSNSTGIFVEKCEATPSAIPNDTVHVSLIHFGCSVIPAVKVLPAPGIDRFRFSLQAFHFSAPANVSNLVYVHCFASTCGGVVCDNSCLQSSRRRKRSVRGQPSATLTSGSHVVS